MRRGPIQKKSNGYKMGRIRNKVRQKLNWLKTLRMIAVLKRGIHTNSFMFLHGLRSSK